MKKFNINEYMYIQITDEGWKHLRATVGYDYIQHCIKTPHYEKIINTEVWYRLQCHQVFEILPLRFGSQLLFKSNVMFDDDQLLSHV